ncbi:DNA polymerase III subunit psi [Rhodoflexus sp.]
MQQKDADIFYEQLLQLPIYLINDHTPSADATEIQAINLEEVQNPVLVVVSKLPLPPAQEELLNKILQAAKITPAMTDIIAIADYQAARNSHRNHILFFVRQRQLPKELAVFGAYSTAPAYEKANVIIANDLGDLITSTDEKKQLWKILQQTFLA